MKVHDDLATMTARALKGAEGYIPLSAAQERELAQRGKAGDTEASWALCMANQNFVRSFAQRFLREGVDLEDLVSEGMVGLMEAAARFDPDRGVKFITYGSWWIKRAILRHLRTFEHAVHVPKYKECELHDYRRARTRLTQELGRTPTTDELAQDTGRDASAIRECAGLSTAAESLDPSGSANEIVDESSDVEALAIRGDALLKLDAALPCLTARERRILRQRFGLDGEEAITLSELGLQVGLTKERVRQIEKEACSRLREHMEEVGVVRSRTAARSRSAA